MSTTSQSLLRGVSGWPIPPVRAAVCIPIFFATSIAFTTLADLPEVEMPTARSSFFPKASSCLEKICSKEKSLAMAVMAEVSVVKARAGKGRLFKQKRLTNSAARCCASAALPPLPKKYRVPPASKAWRIMAASLRISAIAVCTKRLFASTEFLSLSSIKSCASMQMKPKQCERRLPQRRERRQIGDRKNQASSFRIRAVTSLMGTEPSTEITLAPPFFLK